MSDESVKDFVRNTLGCGCDEEVFRHIENERCVTAGGIVLRNRINVGNRLLVYVVEPGSGFMKNLPALVQAGREERDSHGFNRFRLVLASDDATLKTAAAKAFEADGRVDEKMHLHVLGKADITGL